MTAYDEIQNVLVDKLAELAETQKFNSYEVDIPIGAERDYVNKASIPYVIIDFGGKGAQRVGAQGITGTRDDMKWSSVIFDVVANNPRVVRKILTIIRDEFEGYSPDSTWGQLVELIASPLYSRQDSTGGELYPPRYARTVAYIVDVDA